MVCKFCGGEINENANFCQSCGAAVIETASPNGNGRMGRKGKTLRIGIISAILVIAISAAFIFTVLTSSTQNRIKGTWLRDNTTLNTTDTVTYSFNNKGGTNTYTTDSTGFNSNIADFSWHITDDNELIILWSNTSCTRYIWNPDFNSYTLSPNEFNWYLKGDTLYLSTANEQGYFTYIRQDVK